MRRMTPSRAAILLAALIVAAVPAVGSVRIEATARSACDAAPLPKETIYLPSCATHDPDVCESPRS